MNTNCTSALIIKVGDQFFAGFGGKPGTTKATVITKLRPGLSEALFIGGNNTRKAGDYVRRLAEKGFEATVYQVHLGDEMKIIPRVL